MRETILDSFERYWANILDRLPEVTVGVILLLIFIAVGIAIRKVVVNRLKKKSKDLLLINYIGRVIFLFFLIIGIVIFFNQVGLGRAAGGLLAGAGVSALILGFAFKDIGENFIAGFFLAFSRPFNTGDIIEVNSMMGRVRSMSFRNTHIKAIDGRDIYIPNSIMIKNPLTNYTKDGYMRHEFVIGMDYGVDISEATDVILETIKSLDNIVQLKNFTPFVTIDKFGSSTISLKIFFWINTYDFVGSITVLKSNVMKAIINKLMKEGFNMPADILELKIYQEESPIPISLRKNE
ncbi:mechanosensitive ion channel [Marivirga sp. S37H4]|uniref:Mechanosensitive ion channel n=1 Tax=Marivirga aurantiaca TaxID=2802615 RepID=A0A935CC47_9BACT|nr:mechanosensitive ion channel domain-containing protein [Marivirga aurantiaca]MBK6265753.1 mechanosensitive ion channel [Marivirga aurantiaca]